MRRMRAPSWHKKAHVRAHACMSTHINTTHAHTHPRPLRAQRQQSYAELKKLFEDASRVEPTWDKVYFQYAR